MMASITVRLKLDAKRRPTIPTALLDAAGVGAGQDLVARVEGPGRIVLESSAAILAQLQATVAAARASVEAVPVPPGDPQDVTAGSGDAGAPQDFSSGEARQASGVSEPLGQEPASLVDQLFAERAADAALEHDQQ